jgi:alpha-amylase/alpha-mannosidase (GH57 family)
MDVGYLFGPWLRSFSKKQRNLVLVGIVALCWAVWISRNDLVFHKSQYKYILQVMFRATFWIRSWAILSKENERVILKEGCRKLETVALEIFHKSGWNTLKRIDI